MSAAESIPPASGAAAMAMLAALPPPRDALPAVTRLVNTVPRKVVVLDDDPTGTQTVHGLDVLTEWTVPALAAALADPRPGFFVLTNSRSMPEREAVTLTSTLGANLAAAARQTRREYTVISRSDSTLRGHFPAEVDAIGATLPSRYDAVIVIPAFIEVGRLTIAGIHYVREGPVLVPAAETEFARDATFGYRHSDLREWIEEKTAGGVRAESVVLIPLARLRDPAGADWVRDRLLRLPPGTFVVVDAADYGDLEVFVLGLLMAEAAGRCFLYRTAASFVRVRAGLAPRRLLEPAELRGGEGRGGLVVVGSYTDKTTSQLHAGLQSPRAVAFELDVGRLARAGGQEAELARLRPAVDKVLRDDGVAVVYTSRARETALGRAGDLIAGRTVSDALIALVRGIGVRPRFLVAKGGITSSDLAVYALGIRRALVLGQAEPGIPVWRAGAESRWPGLTFVVFPGNVGDAGTLSRVLDRLSGVPE
jgi:uncharacterized protein YgbK (DUF1537 family)